MYTCERERGREEVIFKEHVVAVVAVADGVCSLCKKKNRLKPTKNRS